MIIGGNGSFFQWLIHQKWESTKDIYVYLCLFITQQIQLAMCRNIVMNHGAEQVKQIQQIQPSKKCCEAYSSLLLRLTQFDFNDAIIRGVLFVPLFTQLGCGSWAQR